MEYFADIHCHIIPGVDDGPESLEESLGMLKIAAQEGITDIIATPHYKAGRRSASPCTILERLECLQKAAKERGIPVRLYPGNEIYCFDGMGEALETGRILTLNGTDRVLVEFSPMDSYIHMRNALDGLMGLGYVPVAAHVERYGCLLKHWEYVEGLKRMGVELQVNISGLAGEQGYVARRFTRQLLKRQLVDYVATDAHDGKRRAPYIRQCLQRLSRNCSAAYVEAVTWRNAFKLMKRIEEP